MSCVPVRGCRIGEGRPKVILPIVERTEAATLEKAAAFSTLCADCVEWRVDLFDAAADPGAVVRCLAKLRVLLREKLLLVTLRTKEEGGSIPVSHEGYLRFLRTVLDTDCADLIDIEFFTAGTDLPALVQDAHTAGVKVVCSSHDFHKTPPKAEMVSRMVAMQQAGADLPKLAVMPQSRADVLELLAGAHLEGLVERVCGAGGDGCGKVRLDEDLDVSVLRRGLRVFPRASRRRRMRCA